MANREHEHRRKDGAPLSETRAIGLGVEVAARRSLDHVPLDVADFDTVYFRNVDEFQAGRKPAWQPVGHEVAYRLSRSALDMIIRFVYAIRLLLTGFN